ncbi:MAG: hypothetical protein ACJZ8O_09570 [Pirellulaceae bacterium]
MQIGELLLENGLLNETQLEQSTAQASNGSGVLANALKMGFLDEEAALKAIGSDIGVDFIDLRETDVDLSLLESFPNRLIHREQLFPVERQNGHVLVATSNPFDYNAIDEASSAMQIPIVPVLATTAEIDRLIKRHLGVGSETIDNLIQQRSDSEIELLEDLEFGSDELSDMVQEASVVRLVNEILVEAIDSRASDVHIESQQAGLVVRYRIDGMLHPQPVPPKSASFKLQSLAA